MKTFGVIIENLNMFLEYSETLTYFMSYYQVNKTGLRKLFNTDEYEFIKLNSFTLISAKELYF